MELLRKISRLPASDRSLLVEAVLWLAATRLGLWLLPLQQVRRLLARALSARRPRQSRPSVERIVWAVSAAQRVVPRATCLPQALAAEALLLRTGYAADLRIGVVMTAPGRLVGHAWVEQDGRVVLGDMRDLSSYAPLPPLPRTLP
jgi:transglutaminase superfamily protein